jgi:hypothetical protein
MDCPGVHSPGCPSRGPVALIGGQIARGCLFRLSWLLGLNIDWGSFPPGFGIEDPDEAQ